MKKTYHLIFGLLAVAMPVLINAQSQLAERLIAHLPLDDEIVDVVSGAKPTVLEGTSRVEGRIDGAIRFDEKSYVQLPIDVSPQAVPELTITMWVRPDPVPEDPELAFNAIGYLLSDGDGLVMISNQQKQIPTFGAYSTGTSVHGSNHPGMRGGWQLLAITRTIENRTTDDGELLPHTVLTLYSNGRVSEAARLHKEISILPYISLGRKAKGHPYIYRGAIDDIRVYASAMSPEEIRLSATEQNSAAVAGSRGSAAEEPAATGGTAVYGGPLKVGIDGTSVTPVTDENEAMSTGDAILGADGSRMEEPPDRFGQPPSMETIAGELADSEAQREAIRESAIGNSPLGDRVSQPAVDTDVIDQGVDFDTPPIVADQRADATPVAGTGVIGASDPVFEPPVQGADETQDLLASEEGQDMLQSADWRIEGMVPGSAEKSPLYPGDAVTVKIRISKDDPANRIPSVRLIADVGPGVPKPTYNLTMNTAEAKPVDEREVPITLQVPESLDFADGVQTYWRPRIWLNAADGRPLRDAVPDNHARNLALAVMDAQRSEECGEAIDNPDGTRTMKPCLNQSNSPSEYYIEHKVLVSTNLPFGAGHDEDVLELLVFDETKEPLNDMIIAEVADKPCKLRIAGIHSAHLDSDGCSRSVLPDLSGDALGQNVANSSVVTGLRVCRNSANNRLKGFQFETRRIMPDGSLSLSSDLLAESSLFQCAQWTGFGRCPSGTAAAGIEVRWSEGTRLAPGDFIHSFDLMCGELKKREEG